MYEVSSMRYSKQVESLDAAEAIAQAVVRIPNEGAVYVFELPSRKIVAEYNGVTKA